MKRLSEYAKVLRSKNAGPLYLTFDIMFPDKETLEYINNTGVISAKLVAGLYGVAEDDVVITVYEIVNSIKITIPRKIVSGSIGDTDIYGCQQHMPLAGIMVP